MNEFSHYYTNNVAKSATRQLSFEHNGHAYVFTTDSGVFSKSEADRGSVALIDAALSIGLSGRVLDLGCGWGLIGVILARELNAVKIEFCDVNERAVELARINAKRNGIDAPCYVSDGLNGVPGLFDCICLNPPIRAGRETIFRMIDEARERLTDGGAFIIVWGVKQGAESAKRRLADAFGSVELLRRQSGFHVFLCRA